MKKIVLLILVLMFLLTMGCGNEGSGSAIGDQAYDFEVQDDQGNLVKLSDFKGKTVFLLTWTTT
jgi:cytochrome oxidase Cu insertion factor (SCO1/SenC/PrrC family)